MSRRLTIWMLIVLVILAVIPATDIYSVPAREISANTPVRADRNPTGMTPHVSYDVGKLSGDWRLLVILVEFTDIKHHNSRDTVDEMVFKRMSNYWHEVSYGQFNVIGDTVGWIDLGHDEAYYGKSADSSDIRVDQRDQELVQDACKLAKGVDYTQYEDVMVVYAGHGQDSDSKNMDLIWPHGGDAWPDIVCPGRKFSRAAYVSEVVYEHGLSFGQFTHEFGHTIGLPDLYNTASSAIDARDDFVGLWSIMAEGAQGGPSPGSNPTGLESWSRIKLGWLSTMSIPLTSEGFVQTVNQIGDTPGPRALRFGAKGNSYYLIEVRQEIGVDEYLPDSGVLVTRIDESKDSGRGIVKVMNCHPEKETLDYATCKLNESWSDKSENIYVKVVEKQSSSYVVAVASNPITVTYLKQYPLVIETPTGTSEKWLTPNETVTLGPYDEIIQTVPGTRYLFVSITVDGVTKQSRGLTLTMDQPHTVKANYRKQYLLMIDSEFGDPKGDGWYDDGSEARYSVVSPHGFVIQHILVSWTGDISSSEPQGTLTMTRPYSIKANWRDDYTQLILLMVVLVGAVIGTYAVVAGRRPQIRPLVGLSCRTCGIQNRVGANFCRRCGTSLRSKAETVCASCQTRNRPTAGFCRKCGARLD